jgi:hypothetical protein
MPPGEKGLFPQTSEKRTEVQKAEVLQKGEKISPFSETWLCKERVLVENVSNEKWVPTFCTKSRHSSLALVLEEYKSLRSCCGTTRQKKP